MKSFTNIITFSVLLLLAQPGPAADAAPAKAEAAPPVSIIEASKTANGTLTAGTKTQITKITPLANVGASGCPPFTKTAEAFKAADIDIQKYIKTTKEACTAAADKTESSCVNSPGAQTAKELMADAGSVLGVFTSAQAACSSTFKTASLASAALTLAKGVCTGIQLSCKGLCGTALADLSKTITTLSGLMNTTIDADKVAADGICQSNYESEHAAAVTINDAEAIAAAVKKLEACETEALTRQTTAITASTELAALLKAETAAKPGTSAGLLAGCGAKDADVKSITNDLSGLVQAQKSAADCNKKLSADGASEDQTITRYCEKSENSSTQFCKCESNAQQEGCPNYLAPTKKPDTPAEVAGMILQTDGGVQGFAGANKASPAPSTAPPNDKVNSDDPSSDPNSSGLSGDKGSSPKSAGKGGPGSNSGSRGAGGSDANTKDLAAGNKKWSFGSFADRLGGMFGGKKSSSGSRGGLSAKQEAAINRKLASDKLSGEITSASGKSNWEKIRQAYLIKENSLLGK